MAPRPPEAPEQKTSSIEKAYNNGLDPYAEGYLGGVYARRKGDIDERRQSMGNGQSLKKTEESGGDYQGSDENTAVKDDEEQGGGATYKDSFTNGQNSSQGSSRFNRVRAAFTGTKKKGPVAMVVTFLSILLLGGTTFFGGTLAPLMAVHNITDDLNDQLAAMDIRSGMHIKNKFRPFSSSEATSFGCSAAGSKLPIKCRFNTLSKREVERLKAVGIEVEGETGGVFGNRTKPTGIKYKDGDLITADKVADVIRGDRRLGNAFNQANNMKFIGLTGDTFVRKALGKFNLSLKAPELKGTHEERVKALMARSGSSNVNDLFRPVLGPDGKETGTYTLNSSTDYNTPGDPASGVRIYTQAEYNEAMGSTGNVKIAKRPPSQLALKTLGALNVLGVYDTACSIKNAVGAATVAAKVSNAAQLAAYAMPPAAVAGSLKSGDISPEDAQVIQEFFNSTDAREKIAAYTEISGEGDDATVNATEVPNPNFGKNALDSELYKMSANGGVASASFFDKSYSLGFGASSLLEKSSNVAGIAESILNPGDLEGCDLVQKWYVRGAGAIAGLVAGFFTGGASIAGNAVFFLAATAVSITVDNILNSALSGSIITEDMVFASVDRGTAFWTGMSVVLGQSAQARGMTPGSPEQIVAYQMEQNRVKQEYIALERETSNPLDIKNPYSLTGTIAYSLQNHLPNGGSDSSLASLPISLSSFVFSGLSSLINPYTAYAATLDPERFKQCDDESYSAIGIGADVQCNVRYVMPASSLNIDPLIAAQYMETNRYVKVDTTDGLPEGYTAPNPSETHGLAMDLVLGQIDSIYNRRSYGATDQAEKYGKFLDFCVYRVLPFGETFEENESWGGAEDEWVNGSKCMENSEMLDYFRAYTFDISLDKDLEESPIVSDINCGPFGGSSGGATGTKISETQLTQLIPTYGLPSPQADAIPGQLQYGEQVKGYNELSQQLKDNPKAAWAAQAMLNGEKEWKSAGGDVKEYLNTAWLWFETGQSGWPDPYQMNCQDVATTATKVCPSSNFQSSGYQGENRKNDYIEVFNKLYSESELTSIMESVVKNSTNASVERWNYNDPVNSDKASYFNSLSGVTLNDIAPNQQNFFDEKTQILTLVLGKDPNMSAALNSFAVSDDDLVNALQGDGYGYIKEPAKQMLANMIMALYMFDGQGPSGGATSCSDGGRGAAGSALPGWTITTNPSNLLNYRPPGDTGEPEIQFKHAMLNNGQGSFGVSQLHGPNNSQFAIDNKDTMYGGYDFPSYGFTSVGHPGYDIAMPMGTKLYAPVSGTVKIAGGSGYFYNTAGSKNQSGTGELRIQLSNGDEVVMGHMETIVVKVGDTVSPGTYVGTSGYIDGPHLHLEYRKKDSSCSSGYCILDPTENIP